MKCVVLSMAREQNKRWSEKLTKIFPLGALLGVERFMHFLRCGIDLGDTVYRLKYTLELLHVCLSKVLCVYLSVYSWGLRDAIKYLQLYPVFRFCSHPDADDVACNRPGLSRYSIVDPIISLHRQPRHSPSTIPCAYDPAIFKEK